MPTTALVLETNNLRGGGADARRVASSLRSLLIRLRSQTRPLEALDELVITHDGLSPQDRRSLERAARASIRFVEIDGDVDYYDAKNRGFDATTAELVAFGDADCLPEPRWLEALFAPFSSPDVKVVAGRTTYGEGLVGIAATTIDFMYFPSPLGRDCTRNFYANNVAFRRDVFAAHRYQPADRIYRGHCQVLGFTLLKERIPVVFAPAARTIHRFPDSRRELLRLRLLRGRDGAEMTPRLADSVLPPRARWLGRLGPLSASAVMAARFGFSVRHLGKQDMPEVRGSRRARAVAAIAAISLVDGAAAIARSMKPARRRRAAVGTVLSYHRQAGAGMPSRPAAMVVSPE